MAILGPNITLQKPEMNMFEFDILISTEYSIKV